MQPQISTEWMKVLTYYNSLENQWKRELYLNTLQKKQREYLQNIVSFQTKQSELSKNNILQQSIKAQIVPVSIAATHISLHKQNTVQLSAQYPNQQPITNHINSQSAIQTHDPLKTTPSNSINAINAKTTANSSSPKKSFWSRLNQFIAKLFPPDEALSLPVLLLKYSVVGVTAFVTVALMTSPQSSSVWLQNLPGVKGVFSTKELSAAEKESAFNAWIQSYNKDNWDAGRNSDPDGDGLTNFEEFLLGTKPDVNSTRGLKQSDGQQLLSWTDPSSGEDINPFDPAQIQKYNSVVNRTELHYRLQSLALDAFKLLQLSNQDTLPTSINTDIPGILNVSSAQINNIPVNWGSESSQSHFISSMNEGSVQYPFSAFPDSPGLMYISGNSNDSDISTNLYSSAFNNLTDIQPNELISLEVTLLTGERITYSYIVERINIFDADDMRQFVNRKSSEIALSTCSPAITCDQRLVVTAVRV